ncbi:MAG: peptidase [Bdellovibrionales bacterium]|nr:peptidase [Bdellovibrionales bacterium]
MAKKTAVKKKSAKKPAQRRGASKSQDPIIVDKDKGLVFPNEEALYSHFQKQIVKLEDEFFKGYNPTTDIKEGEFFEYEELLVETLTEPDEIYKSDLVTSYPAYHYMKSFVAEATGEDIYYVAIVYVLNDEPTFVFFHFPTKSASLFELFKQTEKTFDKEIAYQEGDALGDGDPLAEGLYSAMLKIRSEKDIAESEFSKFKKYRDECIEEPDEIWRDPDLQGNVLVSFIKDFTEGSEDLFYVSVAVEDKTSDSHLLLFSFPTNDRSLVDRYRHGENLHAEEIVQGEGH